MPKFYVLCGEFKEVVMAKNCVQAFGLAMKRGDEKGRFVLGQVTTFSELGWPEPYMRVPPDTISAFTSELMERYLDAELDDDNN